MKSTNRRTFLESTVKASTGAFVGLNCLYPAGKVTMKNEFSPTIPLPIQVVIDDVGWWSGYDGSKHQEPFRTGIGRNHVPLDYQAIVELGKALKIRPQAAMVLCEWDKNNILRKLPTATWMGKDWDNSKWVGPWMEEAAEIIRQNRQYLEFTIHGVGHEYWTGGTFSRAEWADVNGRMRPREQVEKHLDYFEKIMLQHNLGSFPTSFVPTAFNHGFGITPGHNISMAEILGKRGATYINTPFHQMYNAEAITNKYFGFDTDVLTINRGRDLLEWNVIGIPPAGELKGPTCGMHWANLIHPDPERNSEIVKEWVQFLAPYDTREDTMLAADSGCFQNQLLYHEGTVISKKRNSILFDFSKLRSFPDHKVRNEFTLKIKGNSTMLFKSESMKIQVQLNSTSKKEYLYTLTLQRELSNANSSLDILFE